MSMTDVFLGSVRTRTLRISVVGLGYVGIPTAAVFAESGFSVTGYDLSQATVNLINEGRCPIHERDLELLVKRNFDLKRLRATADHEGMIENSDCVLICVQTPLRKDKTPDLTFVERVLEVLEPPSLRGKAIVLVSTSSPGTLQKYAESVAQIGQFKLDEDLLLAYAPERIAPGNSVKEFIENTRLVGGIGPNSTEAVACLFETVCREVTRTDVTSAEISKLAENTYRDVNIAFVNELSLVCEATGADITEVIRLANSHPRVALHRPGPGVGGPCLTKDPYFLGTHLLVGRDVDVVTAARRMNDFMPVHVARTVMNALESTGKDKQRRIVALFGMAYKAGVGDLRESPAVRVFDSLLAKGLTLRVYDPYVANDFEGHGVCSVEECVRGADCLVMLTDHPAFRDLDLDELKRMMNENPLLIDARRVVDPGKATRAGFFYFGVGYGGKGRLQNPL